MHPEPPLDVLFRLVLCRCCESSCRVVQFRELQNPVCGQCGHLVGLLLTKPADLGLPSVKADLTEG